MKGNARKYQVKYNRLLQLYSLWQETRRIEVEQECEGLLKEILAIEPKFNLRPVFQQAF